MELFASPMACSLASHITALEAGLPVKVRFIEKVDGLDLEARRRSLDFASLTTITPNEQLKLELKDGRSLTGIIKQQDDKTLTVATANETLTLGRGDVDSIALSQLSMMPEGPPSSALFMRRKRPAFQILFAKLRPSSHFSLEKSTSWPRGERNAMVNLIASAPYWSITSSGSGEFPRLLLILRPSLSRMIPVK